MRITYTEQKAFVYAGAFLEVCAGIWLLLDAFSVIFE